jgi:nitroreductase
MNETLQVIANRRSIRSYQPRQIMDGELQAILDAAIYAPNALNQQRWHFSVVQNQTLIDLAVEAIREGINKSGTDFLRARANQSSYHTFYHAPTVVFITASEKDLRAGVDCGAAAENIALAAASLNIGSVVITSAGYIFESDRAEEMRKVLRIPAGHYFVCAVALGYIAGDRPKVPERNRNVIDYIR